MLKKTLLIVALLFCVLNVSAERRTQEELVALARETLAEKVKTTSRNVRRISVT